MRTVNEICENKKIEKHYNEKASCCSVLCLLSRLQSAVGVSMQLAMQWTDDISSLCLCADEHPSI